ncbi:penicillin acylase family protein [Janibacter sp. G1551]|uniref:penicillin acylase family protein n=1 Tax=Janibacter sp. G1551 TaxID=3420440 RepID=UPI003D090C2F
MSRLTVARRSILGLLALVLVAVMVLGVLAFSIVRRPFPQQDGELALKGLTANVDVLRDDRGVAHLYADNTTDLFMAQGYVHAQDRFFEMDLRRHITAGRLSEMVGEGGVETDTVIRTMGWRRVASQELALLEPETRRMLQAYADGVNAWIDQQDSTSEMALEYTVLGQQVPDYRVEPWTTTDTLAWLKAMAWDLKGNYDAELTRARLGSRVSPGLIKALYPDYPATQNEPILSEEDWSPKASATSGKVGTTTANAPAPRSADLSAGSTATTARSVDEVADEAYADTQAALAAIPALIGQGDGIGSNSWVVGPELSSTGEAMLANDPHLGTSQPGIWVQMGLHCRQVTDACPFDVSGFGFSGVPGIVIGHNADAAWGVTNLGPDVTDFYLEKVAGDTYERDGKREPIESRTETIKVGGGEDVQITVRSTVHGPILSDAIEGVAEAGRTATVDGSTDQEEYAVSLAWTALEPSRTADAILKLNTMTNFEDFRAAARDFEVPSQNLIYADTEGHIGYQSPGRVPVREAVDGDNVPGFLPAKGWESRYDWKGTVPFEDLPWAYDPPEGYIVTANQAVTASKEPFLTSEYDPGYRAQRIRDLLTVREKVTPEDMARIQLDSHNQFAPALVKAMLEVEFDDDPFTAEAQDLLRTWDYNQPADDSSSGAAAAYYNAVWSHIVRLTFNDDLPAGLRASGGGSNMLAVQGLLDKPRSGWWDDRGTAGVVEGRDEILRQAQVDARLELTRKLGKNPQKWRWGQLHTLTLRHAVLGQDVPAPVRWLFNRGRHDMPGGSAIVNANGWDASVGYEVTAAPSMRMVVDLGDLDKSVWVNATGSSGHAFHDNYADQTEAWVAGETYPWRSTPDAVKAAADRTLVLTPETT